MDAHAVARPPSPMLALPVASWTDPLAPAMQAEAQEALESGSVLVFPRLAFTLDAAEWRLLAAAESDGSRKNVSYDPATGALKGTALPPDQRPALAAVMRRFADSAQALLLAVAPGYAPHLERARTSFRPTEIAGRAMPWRKDDTRLHVDAFPSRPTRGRRILRVFVNVDPDGTPRRWAVGEPFEEFARAFLPRVLRPLPGSAAVLHWLGVTKGRRSRYDHIMLQLHDAAKRDAAYQGDTARQHRLDFPPGTAWMVFTDQVPHAAHAGRNALEQTFHLDPAGMAHPERSPLRVLERLTGRALT